KASTILMESLNANDSDSLYMLTTSKTVSGHIDMCDHSYGRKERSDWSISFGVLTSNHSCAIDHAIATFELILIALFNFSMAASPSA
ncbi:hypothetical protein CHS0354_023654, partial [Potamilus streckersoni]